MFLFFTISLGFKHVNFEYQSKVNFCTYFWKLTLIKVDSTGRVNFEGHVELSLGIEFDLTITTGSGSVKIKINFARISIEIYFW